MLSFLHAVSWGLVVMGSLSSLSHAGIALGQSQLQLVVNHVRLTESR